MQAAAYDRQKHSHPLQITKETTAHMLKKINFQTIPKTAAHFSVPPCFRPSLSRWYLSCPALSRAREREGTRGLGQSGAEGHTHCGTGNQSVSSELYSRLQKTIKRRNGHKARSLSELIVE